MGVPFLAPAPCLATFGGRFAAGPTTFFGADALVEAFVKLTDFAAGFVAAARFAPTVSGLLACGLAALALDRDALGGDATGAGMGSSSERASQKTCRTRNGASLASERTT